MKYYKIRSRSNPERYRLSGVHGRWNKSGKTWDSLGKLRSLITMILNSSRSEDISCWEIVEYEVLEVSAKHVYDIIDPKKIDKILAR